MNKNQRLELIISWILSCILLFGVGMWLKGESETLGTNVLFAGLPIITLIALMLAIKNWKKK